MISSSEAFERDACPVGDDMLGHLYRASPNGLSQLVETVPAETRAMLALFCYKRSHLNELAIAIAGTCEKRDLVNWGGALGSVLHGMAKKSAPKAIQEVSSRRKVTLSTKPLGVFAKPVDDEIDFDDEPATVTA
jgi:hypothetical protein